MGLAPVGNDAGNHPTRDVSNATRLPIFFTRLPFPAVTIMVVELRHIVRGGRSSIPCKGDDHTSWCLTGETPMTQC